MTTVTQRHRQAEGQTDNISVAIPRSALRASRGNNYSHCIARLQASNGTAKVQMSV